MSVFRSGLGLSCCHDCCPQCYPLSVCEDSDGCPESGVYVSCKAADWLDEQGAGYTIIYNPQCCLTWNGKTGDEECEDVLEDGEVVIYSEGDDQPSKPIQGYKTGDCEDCCAHKSQKPNVLERYTTEHIMATVLVVRVPLAAYLRGR